MRRWISGATLVIVVALPQVATAQTEPEGPPPTLTVTPDVGLQDFDRVTVSGAGFDPGAHVMTLPCVLDDATSDLDCPQGNSVFPFPFSARFFTADAAGAFDGSFRVSAQPVAGADCRIDHCVLTAWLYLTAVTEPEVVVDLAFDPDAPLRPETFSVVPDTGLVDGQVVEVRADNTESTFSTNFCRSDPSEALLACTSVAGPVSPDSNGAVRLPVAVDRFPEFADGTTADCLVDHCVFFLFGGPRIGPFEILPVEFAPDPEPAASTAIAPRFIG